MASRHPFPWLATVLCGAAMGNVGAAPVLGNLSIAATDREVPVTLHSWQATSFRLAENAGPWRVQKVTLRLAQAVPNDSFTMRIVGEAAFRPAWTDVRASFLTYYSPIHSAAESVEMVALDSPAPVLLPGQTYWLVLGIPQEDPDVTPSTGLYFWSYASSSAADPGGALGWQFGANSASAGTLGAGWVPEATTPFTFSIDAVPELTPVTLASWRLTHPGGPAATAAFLTSDDDRDGLDGLLEFAFNSSPTQAPASGPPVKPILDSQGRFGLEFIRWANAPELSYDVQTSSNLTAWSSPLPHELSQQIAPLADGLERVRIYLLSNTQRSFLRLRITFK
jgi:hypothetical protein